MNPVLKLLHNLNKNLFPPGGVLLFLATFTVSGFRPFITDDAGTVEQGGFELETAADYWHDAAVFGLCFKHGITERMDLGVAFGRCVLPEDESGYDPAELLLKFALIPDQLSASFSGSFSDPCYTGQLVFSQPVSMVTVHVNAGYSAVGAEDNGFAVFGLAGTVDVGQVCLGAELGGTHKSLDWWQAGGRYTFTDFFALDAAIGGDFENDISLTATTGIFYAFPL
jgi:hypothetical protein